MDQDNLPTKSESEIVQDNKIQAQQDLDQKFQSMQDREKNPDVIITEDEIQILQEYLLNIQMIGEYNNDDTPLDTFDSECHNQDGGVIQNASDRYTEDDLIFMINTSEQVKRPIDMLMFLGEYFKEVIAQTQFINENIEKANPSSNKEQSKFYLTPDIMNSLGTAGKLYIENLQQQLRISIALSRNPAFENPEQNKELKWNIRRTQLEIIKRCRNIFKFVDYLDDRRLVVPLKDPRKQSPKYVLKAIFFKMKADNLRVIYECLGYDDGLLSHDTRPLQSFRDIINERINAEITEDDSDFIKCELCDVTKKTSERAIIPANIEDRQDMSLLLFMEHEVYHEYEKAKLQIFDYEMNPTKHQLQDGINDSPLAIFHSVFLTSLMNQQVFKRDSLMQNIRKRLVIFQINNSGDNLDNDGIVGESDIKIEKDNKDWNIEIIEYLKKWNNQLEITNALQTIQTDEDQKMAESVYELLDKNIQDWQEENDLL